MSDQLAHPDPAATAGGVSSGALPADAAGAADAAAGVHRRGSPLAWVLRGLVHLYRATAVFRSPRCRFHPTCSTYALDAIRIHGGLRGAGLAVRRVGRCHPWNPGGIDHVPPPRGAAPGAHPEGALGPVHAPNRK